MKLKSMSMAAMALSALLCLTTSGAVAQSYEAKVFDVPASWAEDETPISAADLPEDFLQITDEEAKALAVPDGWVVLIYGFNGDNVKFMYFENGTYTPDSEDEGQAPRGDYRMFQTEMNVKICYTAAASAEPAGYSVSLKEGTEDASNWQGKAGEGEYQALPLEGVAAGMAVTVKYIGTKKVKSVKAVKKAAPAATVTTAPTAKTGVKAGQNEAIVNAGTAEGGTMMYMVNATQPASTDGFSATVPTAEGLTAGTYYVWYYVKADASHTDSEISASGIEVTIAAAGPKAAAEATAEDIGKIVGADGKIYATKDAAEAVATGNAIAMIAYVGTASDCAHGLAIALEDVSSSNYAWGDAADAVTTWASGKTPPTGCSWRLPSIKDWQYMFIGCGASGSYSDNPSSMSYSGLASKLTTAQGDAFQAFPYWSSTVYNSWGGSVNVWVLMFDEYAPEYGDCNANFNTTNTGFDDSPRVRACLAF